MKERMRVLRQTLEEVSDIRISVWRSSYVRSSFLGLKNQAAMQAAMTTMRPTRRLQLMDISMLTECSAGIFDR